MAISDKIRQVRVQKLGYTQRELASKLTGKHGHPPDQVSVSRWERGTPPSVWYLRQIADLAGLPLEWFYREDEEAA